MEKIVGVILLIASVVISLWIVFVILKKMFGFSSIPKKIEEHNKQCNPSLELIVKSNFRIDDKREALITLELDSAEIKKYRFIRQSMLEEESRGGFDMNSSIESLAFGLIKSSYRNFENEETLWTRYGNAELYEVCIPINFEQYSLLFNVVFEMDRDALAIHLALEKQLEVIVTFKQYVLKEDIVIKAGTTDNVTHFSEFDISYKFGFQSDSKYSNACLGDTLQVIAIDGALVEVK